MFQEAFLISLSSILFLICIIILIIICLPLFLYRLCLSKFIPLIFHKISNIISPLDHVFVSMDIPSNVITTFKIRGTSNLEALKSNILNRMVYARHSNDRRSLMYPQLQQFPTQILGYYFWSWESNFNIDEHVLLYNNNNNNKSQKTTRKLSRNEIDKLENNYSTCQFERNKSPWEFLVVDNIDLEDEKEEPYFLLIQKYHHSLADANSMLLATLKLDCEWNDEKEETSSSIKSSTKILKVKKHSYLDHGISSWIFFPFHASYDIIKLNWLGNNTKLPWVQYTTSGSSGRRKGSKREVVERGRDGVQNILTIKTNPIQVAKIKSIAQLHKTQFSSVVLAGLVGGLRNYLLSNQRLNITQDQLPQVLNCFSPIVLDNTNGTDKLGNYSYMVTLPTPIGNSNSYQRFLECNRIIIERITSTQPYWSNLLMKLIGLLPVLNCSLKSDNLAAGWSCFCGPLKPINIAGQVVQDINYRVGCPDNEGIIMFSYSYASNLQTILNCNTNICSNQVEAANLIKYIQEEYLKIEQFV